HGRPAAHGLAGGADAGARELALPEGGAMARSRQTGESPPLDSVATIRARALSGRERSRIERGLATTWAGSERTVAARIEEVMERTAPDELLASGSTFAREALAASDRRVAALLGSARSGAAAAAPCDEHDLGAEIVGRLPPMGTDPVVAEVLGIPVEKSLLEQ